MKTIFTLLLVSLQAHGAVLQPKAAPQDLTGIPEYQAIIEQLKPYGGFSAKKDPAQPEPVKELSKGQRMVEETKARNRAILAQQTAEEKKERPNEKDILQQWKEEDARTKAAWKKEASDTLAQWKREQDIFLGRIKVYQENTFTLPVKEEKIVEKKITTDIPEVTIAKGAFDVPVRDQRNRPTCSAFAGLRAVEIILAQHNEQRDLSEQYFYWASKSDCQDRPCGRKGSWVTPGYLFSRNHKSYDVPTETNCSYNGSQVDGNETQLPLGVGCRQGSVKILAYEEVRTLADLVEKMKQQVPVILSSKLSENYYVNKGLITVEDSTKSYGKMNGHSLGHSYLAVGMIELPEKLKAREGSFCIVVVNSWGKGWGAGGYSCVTENWLLKYRSQSPFIAVTKVSTL